MESHLPTRPTLSVLGPLALACGAALRVKPRMEARQKNGKWDDEGVEPKLNEPHQAVSWRASCCAPCRRDTTPARGHNEKPIPRSWTCSSRLRWAPLDQVSGCPQKRVNSSLLRRLGSGRAIVHLRRTGSAVPLPFVWNRSRSL